MIIHERTCKRTIQVQCNTCISNFLCNYLCTSVCYLEIVGSLHLCLIMNYINEEAIQRLQLVKAFNNCCLDDYSFSVLEVARHSEVSPFTFGISVNAHSTAVKSNEPSAFRVSRYDLGLESGETGV